MEEKTNIVIDEDTKISDIFKKIENLSKSNQDLKEGYNLLFNQNLSSILNGALGQVILRCNKDCKHCTCFNFNKNKCIFTGERPCDWEDFKIFFQNVDTPSEE